MKRIIFRLWVPWMVCVFSLPAFSQEGLKDTLGKYFLVGAALNQWTSDGQDAAASAVVRQHFNCAVAENCMKAEVLQPAEGIFDFRVADKFVNYCQQNNLQVIGHCLLWHSQAPDWMFTDSSGNLVSREKLIDRIRKHIATVVGHFRGKIHGWDVLNEIIEDDGSFRESPLYKILGEEFVEIAFRAAREADPDAELYLNDYSMAKPAKRATYLRLIREMQAKGLRLDAIGMQSHNGIEEDHPVLEEYEQSIEAFARTGLKVMITELDLNLLPLPWELFNGAEISQNFVYEEKWNPYVNGVPADVQKKVHGRWMDFFRIYYKHRDHISRITFWGVSDATSWLNDWPIAGRTNYPLFFDRQYQPKPIVEDVIRLFNN